MRLWNLYDPLFSSCASSPKIVERRGLSNKYSVLVKLAGVGRHVQAVILDDPNKLTTRPKIDKAVEIFSVAALTGSKLVILSLYLRVFSSRPYRIATYLTGAIIVATWFTFFILSFTICRPLAFQWDKTIPGGHCLNIIRAYQILGAPNILTDVIMLILPIPAVYNLRVNLATKIGVLVTFLTGSAYVALSKLGFILTDNIVA